MTSAVSIAASALLVTVTVGACGGGGDDGADSGSGWAVSDCSEVAEPSNESQPASGSTIEGTVAVAGSMTEAPTVSIEGDAAPATSLATFDIVAGSGEPVTAGAEVTVQYCGLGLTSRTIFDSSWARGEPITFPLAGVIAGWQDGIPGMEPGGRRLLVIPADMAYGENPPPGSGILPGETLVFVVDLLSAN
jgi:peptidylprolyl isomerase